MISTRLKRIEEEILKTLPDLADRVWFERTCCPIQQGTDLRKVDSFCEPGRNLLRRGGKRWRPLLMVLIAEILGGEEGAQHAYPLAPVVELPHNGSLIIDDIEDNSDMRRGDPAVHTMYGIDLSINAGNLLYYLPTICIDRSALPDTVKLQLYQVYSRYLRRVHFGQGFDISWHRDLSYIPDEASYRLMCRLKTGCLSGMAAEIGASAARALPDMVLTAGAAAEQLGVAFQVMDDVINLETGNPGKMRGDDIIEGKKSLPLILHAKRRPEKVPELISMLNDVRTLSMEGKEVQPVIEEVIAAIEASGALDEARKTAEKMYSGVISRFEQILPPCEARDELLGLLTRMK